MKKAIFKYSITSGIAVLPINAQVLMVALQHGTPHVWANVNVDEDTLETYKAFPTGSMIDDERWEHVGSWQRGPLVWHLYRENR